MWLDEHMAIRQMNMTQFADFEDVVDVCELFSFGYCENNSAFEKRVVGGSYTCVRLDRAPVNMQWCDLFTLLHLLFTSTLDHRRWGDYKAKSSLAFHI